VLRWPDVNEVKKAFEKWAQKAVSRIPAIRKIGYMGSYVRGDWGVGSDLDVVVVIDAKTNGDRESIQVSRLSRRSIPVPVDLQVFEKSRWDRLMQENSRFARTLRRECVFVFQR